jgi:hypothetical protein
MTPLVRPPPTPPTHPPFRSQEASRIGECAGALAKILTAVHLSDPPLAFDPFREAPVPFWCTSPPYSRRDTATATEAEAEGSPRLSLSADFRLSSSSRDRATPRTLSRHPCFFPNRSSSIAVLAASSLS